MRLPIDPKDLALESEPPHDSGLTVETVIPGTVSLVDVPLPFPRVNGSGVLLASPEPDPVLGIFVAGDVRRAEAAAQASASVGPDSHPSNDALASPAADPLVAALTPVPPSETSAPLATPEDEAELDRRPANWVIVLLGSYASAMTVACLWLWWQGRHRVEASPPDETQVNVRFERGFRADRSAVLSPPAPIAPNRFTEIGKPLSLAALEFTPLELSQGQVMLRHRGLDGDLESRDGGEEALVLRVRLKNTSSNQVFAPLDEAFLRQRERGSPDSFVETSGGGRIELFPLAVESEWSIVGQEFKELSPGETLETMVVSEPDATTRVSSEMTWRLRLRTSTERTDTVGVRLHRSDLR
jgi:hypothetical protein